ncbi:MAG: type III pantothenate kinase [Pseudomonadales bacterium]|jgi:type III pantothenate kinase|nr:type III pantothenate kinase [Pseudomonadales bacterium]MDP6471762.1 type III pantothenate kinase [Pseudomonadales bacterium]|tara:strand:+ start:391 stop:1188 length:798 start_codon:yes stop_codon:yes gene_type:complete
MILALDVGNSQIYCGVFDGPDLISQFRRTSSVRSSSDELGVFLRGALRENGVDPDLITTIATCSVVPDINYSLRACCQKYFNINPMIMRPGIKTGLRIKYKDPKEVGADRIADAMGAVKLYPNRNLIVVDFGTATTVCAITAKREFLGGNIMPGVRLAMDALESKTAQLPSVEIKPVRTSIGQTTIESIQSGLYWSNVGMVKELVTRITDQVFADDPPLVIGTGGFAHLFDREDLFDAVVPDLILTGLLEALRMNPSEATRSTAS